MEILDKIVEFAMKYNGIEEIPGNMGWENELFEEMMHSAGWEEGQAWCMFLVKGIYLRIFENVNERVYNQIKQNFTGSATETYENVRKLTDWHTTTKYPTVGGVVIWRKWNNGVRDWRGHAGIPVNAGNGGYGNMFRSIEGNTNDDGSRVGKEVAIKDRINNHGEKHGLVVEGFFTPPISVLEKMKAKGIVL